MTTREFQERFGLPPAASPQDTRTLAQRIAFIYIGMSIVKLLSTHILGAEGPKWTDLLLFWAPMEIVPFYILEVAIDKYWERRDARINHERSQLEIVDKRLVAEMRAYVADLVEFKVQLSKMRENMFPGAGGPTPSDALVDRAGGA